MKSIKLIKIIMILSLFLTVSYSNQNVVNSYFNQINKCIKMTPGIMQNITFIKNQRKQELYKLRNYDIIELTKRARELSDLKYNLIIQGEETGCEKEYNYIIKEVDKFKEIYIRELKHRGVPDIALDFI